MHLDISSFTRNKNLTIFFGEWFKLKNTQIYLGEFCSCYIGKYAWMWWILWWVWKCSKNTVHFISHATCFLGIVNGTFSKFPFVISRKLLNQLLSKTNHNTFPSTSCFSVFIIKNCLDIEKCFNKWEHLKLHGRLKLSRILNAFRLTKNSSIKI